MHVVNLAARLSEEATVNTAHTPAWVFGVVAFVALVVLLILTMMVKVGR